MEFFIVLLKLILAIVFTQALVKAGGNALARNKSFQRHMEKKYFGDRRD